MVCHLLGMVYYVVVWSAVLGSHRWPQIMCPWQEWLTSADIRDKFFVNLPELTTTFGYLEVLEVGRKMGPAYYKQLESLPQRQLLETAKVLVVESIFRRMQESVLNDIAEEQLLGIVQKKLGQ